MNYAAMVAWLKELLPMLGERHHKILVVTYKPYAERLWWDLRTFHDMLIPYVAPDGSYQNKLPYFGGMNGSNVYQESTCAVCAGLNRFEMKDYIARTIALDLDNHITAQLQTILEATEGDYMLINDPSVLDTQNKLLASDLIQLVFRTALRHHGSKVPIDLWIVSPPSGVIDSLKSYFGDCRIEETNEVPEACYQISLIARTRNGDKTNSSKMMSCLMNVPPGGSITPATIRAKTGLTQNQFKETRKNPRICRYLEDHFLTSGSGKNTVYHRRVS